MRFVYSLLCVLALALTAPAHADTPSPNQVVQMLVDDLGKTMEARRAELSKDREGLLKQKGCTIWLTGLPSSGKSTLAFSLEHNRYQGDEFLELTVSDFRSAGAGKAGGVGGVNG